MAPPPPGGFLYLGLGLLAGLGVVVHVDGGRVDEDDGPAQLLLGVPDGLQQVLGGAVEGRHNGVHPVAEVGLQHGLKGLYALVAAADHLVGGGAGVAPAQHPVGAHKHAGQRDPSHGGAGKFIHSNTTPFASFALVPIRAKTGEKVKRFFKNI